MLRVSDATPEKLTGVQLLVVGSPTHRFNPTPATTSLLKGTPGKSLHGIKVAAFDTRLTQAEIDEIRILAFMVKFFGYAADPIAKKLEKMGGKLVIPPEGFYVSDTEGPLLKDELQRAAAWAAQIIAAH